MRDRPLPGSGLTLHALEWGTGDPPVLLLHGYLEHAHAWDFVAPRLADALGRRVVALDARGHGDSDWVGAGGYYHYPDYVADLAFVVRALGGRVALVGHSMGGNAAVLYAGTEPERVTALVTIEGLGPPGADFADAPTRTATWIEHLETNRREKPRRRHHDLEAAVRLLHGRFPGFGENGARHMATHGTREEGDGFVWKFDPLHQSRGPQPFYEEQARAFWARITCPRLYVEGDTSPIATLIPTLAERVAAFGAERIVIEGSGHHPHLETPEKLTAVLVEFLGGTK